MLIADNPQGLALALTADDIDRAHAVGRIAASSAMSRSARADRRDARSDVAKIWSGNFLRVKRAAETPASR
jgi:hypothetical protein